MGTLWKPGKVYLSWPEGHYLHGLEITMRRRPLGELLAMWERDNATPPAPKGAPLVDQVPFIRRTADDLAELIVVWNATDDSDTPVPVTGAALLSVLSDDDVQDVWTAYRHATERVAPPLPSSSDDGQHSAEQELQLPMEPMSDSPPS